MKANLYFVVVAVVLIALMSGCASPTPPATIVPTQTPEPMIPTTIPAPEKNLTDGCVDNYNAETDYFPEKVTLTHASGFTIEYFKNFKVVTVKDPYSETESAFQYVLVQCGTPIPDGYDTDLVIEVPVKSIVSLNSSYLPFLKALNLYERLIGVDTVDWIYDPDVLQMAKDGKVLQVGFGGEVNVEQVLNLDPALIMTGIYRQAQFNAYPKLSEAGLNVVINTDFLESTPLGRLEWIKFMGAFFNRENAATEYFTERIDRYNQLANLAKDSPNKPSVLWGVPGKDRWFVPGGNSFEAAMLSDAGSKYWWDEDTETGKIPLSFESVFDVGANSDIWLIADGYPSMAEMLSADSRLSSFSAISNNQVWSNDAKINDAGGNDYWESGVVNPDVVLADFIKIFHPELLPDHELVYWRLLK